MTTRLKILIAGVVFSLIALVAFKKLYQDGGSENLRTSWEEQTQKDIEAISNSKRTPAEKPVN